MHLHHSPLAITEFPIKKISPTQKTTAKTIPPHRHIHTDIQRRPLLQQSFRQWFMRRPSSITGRMLDPDLYTRVCSLPLATHPLVHQRNARKGGGSRGGGRPRGKGGLKFHLANADWIERYDNTQSLARRVDATLHTGRFSKRGARFDKSQKKWKSCSDCFQMAHFVYSEII